MVVAVLCRFYGWRFMDVLNMTIGQVRNMLEKMPEIMKMELGGEAEQEVSLSGEAAFRVAQTLFRGRRG